MGLFSVLAPIAGSLVGGLLDKKSDRSAQRRANEYENPAAIRARYEAAGFNPLLAFTGNGAGTIQPQVGRSNSFQKLVGQSFDLAQNEKFQTAQLEQENRRLELMAEELTLKEKSYSAYDRNSGTTGVGGGLAASVMTEAPTQPPAPPTIAPKFGIPGNDARPTSVNRTDGLTSSNPEAPTEPEQDAWNWAREGTLLRNGNEILERNLPNYKRRNDSLRSIWRGSKDAWDKFNSYSPYVN